MFALLTRCEHATQPAGNRTSETREDGSYKLWTYDQTSQLISEEIADDVGTSRTTYIYDPVGNRLVLDVDGEPTTSTYDAANRLITAEDLTGITTYTFDVNGNQRIVKTPSGDITTYSWSYENQLIQIEEPHDVVTTQTYAPVTRNSDELRFSVETDAGITNFIWDKLNIILEVDETSSVEAEYTLNPQPYGNLVSQRREAESAFYNYDALGSTESLTDQAGTKTDEYTYSAFGKVLTHTGSTENPYTWIGELGCYREPNGRYDLRAREYNEAINRFLSEDPLKFDAGDENLYRYVRNNPISLIDPSGLILIAIDGTSTREWLTDPKNPHTLPNGQWLSHVRNFYVDYTDRKAYWYGPDWAATALDINGIIRGAYEFACSEWCKTKEPIDLIGWSRGGLAVIEVAKLLNEKGCKCCEGGAANPISIRFLGLYDPVDMTPCAGNFSNQVPPNVQNGMNVYGKQPEGRSYKGVDYTAPGRIDQCWPRIIAFKHGSGIDVPFNCTHGALGGCPGYSGDEPWFYWYFWDREQSIKADRMMRLRAKAAGVPIRVLAPEDYGFPAHQQNLPPIRQ